MIIHTPTSRMFPLFSVRKAGYISPVVVGQQHDNIIRCTKSHIIVALHFFVDSPDLRAFFRSFSRYFLDNPTLVLEDFLQQTYVVLVTCRIFMVFSFFTSHWRITVPTHTNGDKVFRIGSSFNSLAEKLIYGLLVGCIVPYAIFLAFSCPFLMVTCHRLVMGGSHNNPHFIGGFAVFRIVCIKAPTPHGRPHKITAQAKDQFEHTCIKTVITVFCTIRMFYPTSQARSFIIKEDSSISDSGFAICIDSGFYIDIFLFGNRNVRPPIPGRYTHLSGEFVYSVNCSPFVATCNHQSLINSFAGISYDL